MEKQQIIAMMAVEILKSPKLVLPDTMEQTAKSIVKWAKIIYEESGK